MNYGDFRINKRAKAVSGLLLSSLLLGVGIPKPVQAVDFSSVPGEVLDYQSLTYFGDGPPLIFISDPEIVVLPNGNYIASHALAGVLSGSATSGKTTIFRSTDKGATWTSLGTLSGILRGSLFCHNGAIYLLGSNHDDTGSTAVLMKSTDNGSSWSSLPFTTAGVGTPNNPVVWSNRIWSAGSTAIYSVSTNNDLMNTNSWERKTGFPTATADWITGASPVITEGQVVASPDLGVFILPKVKQYALTALSRVDSGRSVRFDPVNNFVALPGGEKKFGAAYDAGSGKFFVLSNPLLQDGYDSGLDYDMIRNTAAVLSSRDLLNWKVEKIFLYSPDVERDGFGYLNFDFDGTNMAVIARTAFPVGSNDPERGHDSNLLTFHRLNDFRNLAPDQYLTISGNQVLRHERTQHTAAPLGSFTLGSTFAGAALNAPTGMGKTSGGHVYIRESGGRILHFDALGNFIETNSTAPVTFQSTALNISQPSAGECAWKRSNSGSWSDPLNWYYWGRADTTEEIAVFGSAAAAASTITVPSATQIWNFNTDGDKEGWVVSSAASNNAVNGGFLQGSANTTSSVVTISRVDRFFYGSTVPEVRIRFKADANCTVNFYWGTTVADSVGASARKLVQSYTGNREFQELVFSTTGNANWDGKAITQLRFEPLVQTNSAGQGFAVDSITVSRESCRLKGLRFRNPYPYTLSGTDTLRIEAASGTGSIEVFQGRHTNNVALILGSDTDMTLTNNTSLHLKKGIDLNGKTLHATGSGRLLMQGALVMNGGTIAVDGVTPLTFTNNSTGSLLDGTFRFLPSEPFSPAIGTSFDLLDNQSLLSTNRFAQISLPALPEGMQWNTNTLYSSGNILVESIPKISIPFTETFEGITAGSNLLVPGNTNGWYGGTNTASAIVTNVSYAWAGVLHPIENAAHTKVLECSGTNLTALFETNAAPANTTLDFMVFCPERNESELDTPLVTDSQMALYVDVNGFLNVWYGLDSTGTNNAWLIYTNTPVGTSDWARVTVAFDYTTDVSNGCHFFKVTLNGVELKPAANGYSKGTGTFNPDTDGTWLLTANPAPTQIQSFTAAGEGMLDDLVVTTAAVTNFFPPSYTLTGNTTGNGTVSPAGTNVPTGGSADFVITANSYYRIASLSTNGTDTGLSFDNNSTTTNFIWSNVQSAGTLTAAFIPRTAADPANTPYPWLAQHGLTNFSADAVADADGDGLLTWQEYVAGTDPTDSSSVFQITGGGVNAQGAVIRWSSVSNRFYSLSRATNLLESFSILPEAGNIPATPPENVYTNLSPDSSSAFYRINVLP